MKNLIFLLAVSFLMTANSACSNSGSNAKGKEVSTEVNNNVDATLLVQGSCEMCKKRIEKAAQSVDGVTSAEWNSETKELTFSYDEGKTSLEVVSKAIAKVGYDTENDKADDEVYESLPACCQYRG